MKRSLVGNILLLSFFVLTLSGVVMYFFSFEKSAAAIHTLFALIFLTGVSFHMVNNKVPLTNYLLGRRSKYLKKLQSPALATLFLLICTGAYLDVPAVNGLYNWGNEFRNSREGKSEDSFVYQTITVNSEISEENMIAIEVKKGEAFQYPLFAIWMEDSSGRYLETLYISRVIASGVFDYGIEVDGVWKPSVKRRPEALPYWSHKRNIQAADGYYVPLKKALDLDGVSGATPTDNFIVQTRSKVREQGGFRILMEVNQSYDWNDFYHEQKFPNDTIYSGSGKVGQPALIYESELFRHRELKDEYSLMRLVGHGHHSGQDGKLYRDLSKVTTAKNIVDRVIIKIPQKKTLK